MKRIVSGLIMSLAVVLSGSAAAAGVGTLPGFVKIKPSHSNNKCLNSMNKSLDMGKSIVQWSCSDQDTQRFSITLNADGFHSIKSKGSNFCFGVPYAWQGKIGVTLYQVACPIYERHSNEFIVRDEGNGLYSISPALAPHTCLGVTYSSQDMFASVVQENCSQSANQLFSLVAE